jgi:uncharacterized integral membrane protein
MGDFKRFMLGASLFTILLTVLKLIGATQITWTYVFAPFWIPIAILLFLAFMLGA